MLFRCNILALVSERSEDKVMIWDDHQNRVIGELIFDSEVRAVRLRRDLVAVVLTNKVYIYNFADLRRIEGEAGAISTVDNTLGLCDLCPSSDNCVLACPGESRGMVKIVNYSKRNSMIHFQAHETDLVALSLTLDGSMVATASAKGTLIRVFSTEDGSPLHELRRGTDKAFIQSICFDNSYRFLASSSDKGTIHVFSLDGSFNASSSDAINHEARASRGFISGLLPKYFSSVWSFAQVTYIHAYSVSV